MPTPVTVMRSDEIDRIVQELHGFHCVALIGLSNMGKSTLLRSLRHPDVVARYVEHVGRQAAFVYIDCNGMLELSGQGFYELVLRSIREDLGDMGEELREELATHYTQVIDPDSQFLVPLSFNNALTSIIEAGHRDLILMFDAFDEAFDALDGRVFLNLRALKDKYPRNLIYITSTLRRPGTRRSDEQTAEFVELTAPYTYPLGPLTRDEANELTLGLAHHAGVYDHLDQEELDFVWRQSGGHPRLLRAAVSQLTELLHRTASGGPMVDELDAVLDRFHHDPTIRHECNRLWGSLTPDERRALTAIVQGKPDQVMDISRRSLTEWGLVDSDLTVFSDLFADYIRRQARVQEEIPSGIWIDDDAGDVWVEGVLADTLTELEFKLMSLLYERRNKLTDKYQIVETVWGVDYIDEVDDARIEKLVSRLRSKIEPDSTNPRYIMTVRGRGYRLILPE